LAKLKNCTRISNYEAGKSLRDNKLEVITNDEFQQLINEVPLIQLPEVDLSDADLLKFFDENVKIDLKSATELNKMTSTQNNPLWKNARKLRITASTCYSLYTYSKNKNPDWEKKYDGLHRSFSTPATVYGKSMEEPAFRAYQRVEPSVKRSGLCVNPKYPWVGCSPDGIIVEKRRIIEIKCLPQFKQNPVDMEAVKFVEKVDGGSGNFILKKKHQYYGQVQLNMFLMSCTSADLVIYSKSTDSFVAVLVQYDYNFVLNMLETLKLVYFSKLLPIIFQKFTET
jgi:YqaJ-like viral recombinase domain